MNNNDTKQDSNDITPIENHKDLEKTINISKIDTSKENNTEVKEDIDNTKKTIWKEDHAKKEDNKEIDEEIEITQEKLDEVNKQLEQEKSEKEKEIIEAEKKLEDDMQKDNMKNKVSFFNSYMFKLWFSSFTAAIILVTSFFNLSLLNDSFLLFLTTGPLPILALIISISIGVYILCNMNSKYLKPWNFGSKMINLLFLSCTVLLFTMLNVKVLEQKVKDYILILNNPTSIETYYMWEEKTWRVWKTLEQIVFSVAKEEAYAFTKKPTKEEIIKAYKNLYNTKTFKKVRLPYFTHFSQNDLSAIDEYNKTEEQIITEKINNMLKGYEKQIKTLIINSEIQTNIKLKSWLDEIKEQIENDKKMILEMKDDVEKIKQITAEDKELIKLVDELIKKKIQQREQKLLKDSTFDPTSSKIVVPQVKKQKNSKKPNVISSNEDLSKPLVDDSIKKQQEELRKKLEKEIDNAELTPREKEMLRTKFFN